MADFCKLSTVRSIECSFHPCMPLRALRLLLLLNAAKSNSATFTLQVAASRALSTGHGQPKIPIHGTRRGKNSTKSGSPILTAGPSRYTLLLSECFEYL
jgi:hypothetical protein